ncbi:MAG: XylR N-terminal domain-containing protein, partial [Elusimicrobia bacterium]|nr:XylR N-terminal domain-containing protein [Elusimicrobiota bacterium]
MRFLEFQNSTLTLVRNAVRGNTLDTVEFTLERLLRLSPEEGRLWLGDSRAILLTTQSMGALRKALIDTVGIDYARGILLRFGFACGYSDAVGLRARAAFKNDREWLLAGPRMHALVGHVQAEPIDFTLSPDHKQFHVRARWINSYEAEEHRAFLGKADQPVCWSLTGYASGWATAVLGEKALAVETGCAAMGRDCCELEIRRLAEWDGAARRGAGDLEAVDLRHEMSLLERSIEALRASRRGRGRRNRSPSGSASADARGDSRAGGRRRHSPPGGARCGS